MRAALLLALFVSCALPAVNAVKNVVLIVSDDMRPELNKAYGANWMYTPNFDKLADESLVFNRAYTQFAICSASRNSFLSGRRPDRTKVWNFINDFRQAGPDWTSFPEHFKKNGYTTLGCGKIYHPGHPPNNDEPLSWSQDKPYGKQSPDGCKGTNISFCQVNTQERNNPIFNDYKMAQCAISNLEYAVKKGDPFFIALGLHYPHLNWHVPTWAVDYYKNVKPPKYPYPPKEMPLIAFTEEVDGKEYLGVEYLNGTIIRYHVPSPSNWTYMPDWFMEDLRRGYYSAISLSDHHAGLMLAAIDRLGIANDTVVVFTADHGYQLGEHAEWAKHTNFELATRVPMMIRAPWLPNSIGKKTQHFSELQDLYKTVSKLAGLPEPEKGVEGMDLSPLLDNPSGKAIREVAFSQYSRCPEKDQPVYYHPNCEGVEAKDIGVMGYSVRTDQWRYTEWFKWNGTELRAEWSEPSIGVEFYSHVGDLGTDFDAFENENVASDPKNAKLMAVHRNILLKHFKDEEAESFGALDDILTSMDGN